jgi:hypothetical protein
VTIGKLFVESDTLSHAQEYNRSNGKLALGASVASLAISVPWSERVPWSTPSVSLIAKGLPEATRTTSSVETQIPSYALRRTVSRFLTPVRGLRQRIQWCFLKARDSTASSSES